MKNVASTTFIHFDLLRLLIHLIVILGLTLTYYNIDVKNNFNNRYMNWYTQPQISYSCNTGKFMIRRMK